MHTEALRKEDAEIAHGGVLARRVEWLMKRAKNTTMGDYVTYGLATLPAIGILLLIFWKN